MMYASVFLLLIIKHCICDYGIQGRFDPKATKDKSSYNALMYLSIVVFAFSDLVIHSMIDCVKNKVIHGNGYHSSQRIYWWINMIDQIAHNVTYFIFLWCFDKYFF